MEPLFEIVPDNKSHRVYDHKMSIEDADFLEVDFKTTGFDCKKCFETLDKLDCLFGEDAL